jgi:glycosyltransferase involved in cell wall biosynthesis
MPLYNSQRYVAQAIRSLLQQTWINFELLIINDASTDDSRQIVTALSDPRIRLVDNPHNLGLVATLNRGLELARGSLIARMDSDDVAHPERLAQQVAFLRKRPDVALLGTQARLIDERNQPITNSFLTTHATSSTGIRWHLLFECPFVHSSVMFRRNIVHEQMGGYRSQAARFEDWELWSRIARLHAVHILPDVLVDFRKHTASATGSSRHIDNPRLRDLLHDNLRHFLHIETVPAAWLDLLDAFLQARSSRQFAHSEQFAHLVQAVYARFCACHPDAAHDAAVRRYRADLLARAAYHSALQQRATSLQLYLQACRHDPSVIRRIPLVKYAALWLLGEPMRRAYHRLGRTTRNIL